MLKPDVDVAILVTSSILIREQSVKVQLCILYVSLSVIYRRLVSVTRTTILNNGVFMDQLPDTRAHRSIVSRFVIFYDPIITETGPEINHVF